MVEVVSLAVKVTFTVVPVVKFPPGFEKVNLNFQTILRVLLPLKQVAHWLKPIVRLVIRSVRVTYWQPYKVRM